MKITRHNTPIYLFVIYSICSIATFAQLKTSTNCHPDKSTNNTNNIYYDDPIPPCNHPSFEYHQDKAFRIGDCFDSSYPTSNLGQAVKFDKENQTTDIAKSSTFHVSLIKSRKELYDETNYSVELDGSYQFIGGESGIHISHELDKICTFSSDEMIWMCRQRVDYGTQRSINDELTGQAIKMIQDVPQEKLNTLFRSRFGTHYIYEQSRATSITAVFILKNINEYTMRRIASELQAVIESKCFSAETQGKFDSIMREFHSRSLLTFKWMTIGGPQSVLDKLADNYDDITNIRHIITEFTQKSSWDNAVPYLSKSKPIYVLDLTGKLGCGGGVLGDELDNARARMYMNYRRYMEKRDAINNLLRNWDNRKDLTSNTKEEYHRLLNEIDNYIQDLFNKDYQARRIVSKGKAYNSDAIELRQILQHDPSDKLINLEQTIKIPAIHANWWSKSTSDSHIKNGETLSIESGVVHEYNNLIIDEGAVLKLNEGSLITVLCVRGDLIVNGKIIGKMGPKGNLKIKLPDNWPGKDQWYMMHENNLNYMIDQKEGGHGGPASQNGNDPEGASRQAEGNGGGGASGNDNDGNDADENKGGDAGDYPKTGAGLYGNNGKPGLRGEMQGGGGGSRGYHGQGILILCKNISGFGKIDVSGSAGGNGGDGGFAASNSGKGGGGGGGAGGSGGCIWIRYFGKREFSNENCLVDGGHGGQKGKCWKDEDCNGGSGQPGKNGIVSFKAIPGIPILK